MFSFASCDSIVNIENKNKNVRQNTCEEGLTLTACESVLLFLQCINKNLGK